MRGGVDQAGPHSTAYRECAEMPSEALAVDEDGRAVSIERMLERDHPSESNPTRSHRTTRKTPCLVVPESANRGGFPLYLCTDPSDVPSRDSKRRSQPAVTLVKTSPHLPPTRWPRDRVGGTSPRDLLLSSLCSTGVTDSHAHEL